jgi:hypothetical protein
MPLTTAELQAAVDTEAGRITWLSLHTGAPGTTGANEATGGSPAYARKQTTWGAANASGVAVGSQVTFDVPAGTYAHVGFWSAPTGGTFRGSIDITDEVFAAQGQYLFTPTLDGDTT